RRAARRYANGWSRPDPPAPRPEGQATPPRVRRPAPAQRGSRKREISFAVTSAGTEEETAACGQNASSEEDVITLPCRNCQKSKQRVVELPRSCPGASSGA